MDRYCIVYTGISDRLNTVMEDDAILISEIYQSMYTDRYIIEENFFKSIAKHFTIKNATIAATIAAIIAGVVNTRRNSDSDTKQDELNRLGSTMSALRRPATTEFGNIFSDDESIKAFIEDKIDGKFLISPRQFFTSRYGEGWQRVLDNARKYKADNPTIDNWADLSDEVLDTPLYVRIHSIPEEGDPSTGGYFLEMRGEIHIYLPAVRSLGGIGEVLTHEFSHALQKFTTKQRRQGIIPSQRGSYIGGVDEIGVRIAKLVHIYYQKTGRLITSPEEADKALEMFGIKLNATPQEIERSDYINVPEDVRDLRYSLYKLTPEDFKKVYELLRIYMPSVVQQTLNDSNKSVV